MSDPVTNAEVEDVLSSIRRLVSEEKRPAPKLQAEPQGDRLVLTPSLRVTEAESVEPAAPPHVAEQQVGTTDTPVGQSVSGIPKMAVPTPQSLVSDDTPFDITGDGFADFTQPPEAAVDDDIPDVDDPVLEAEEIDSDVLFDAEDTARGYSTAPDGLDDEVAQSVEEDDSHLRRFFLRDRELSVDTVTTTAPVGPEIRTNIEVSELAEAEPAPTGEGPVVSETPGAEPRVSEMAPERAQAVKATEQDSLQSNTVAETIPASDVESASEPAAESESEPALETKADPAPLSAKVAALETAVGQISENSWEPEDAGESDYAGSEAETMAWEDDVVEAEVRKPIAAAALRAAFRQTAEESKAPLASDPAAAQPSEVERTRVEPEGSEDYAIVEDHDPVEAPRAPEIDDPIAADAAPGRQSVDRGDFEPEEQLIDEEALRDLVADIVREELQGALGERITRNVRKLVRREIHRALTAQELE